VRVSFNPDTPGSMFQALDAALHPEDTAHRVVTAKEKARKEYEQKLQEIENLRQEIADEEHDYCIRQWRDFLYWSPWMRLAFGDKDRAGMFGYELPGLLAHEMETPQPLAA